MDDLTLDTGTPAAVAAPAAPAAETPVATPAAHDPAAQDAGISDAELGLEPKLDPEAQRNADAAFMDELDSIGTESETPATPAADDKAAAIPTNPGTDASKATEKPAEKAAEAATEPEKVEDADIDDDDDEPAAEQVEPDPLTDWGKVAKDEEAYIQKHLPKTEWKQARKWYRDANMARAYMSPVVPAHVVVDNLAKKSEMRFGEVTSEILKRAATADPVGMLTKVFESTADAEGNSEVYQKLLDGVIETNTDYALTVLKRAGYDLAPKGSEANPAKSVSVDEIDAFQESELFKNLADVDPAEAAKLKSLLDGAKEAKATAEALEAKKADEEKASETDAQVAARNERQAKVTTAINSFQTVYADEITSTVDTILDKTYGLEVTAEEKTASPTMAKLKMAKRAMILNGGLDGTGDFDNDLYEYGKTRPAFKQAADAMVKFTEAGETENAKAQAKELKKFASMFLAERMNHEDVKFIDEMIQIYAAHQKASLSKPTDKAVPDDTLGRTPQGGGNSLMDEIDRL